MPHVIILAAGKGSRMKSEQPKVLHAVGGVPMIHRVLQTAEQICARPTIVVGYKAGDVIQALGEGRDYVVQEEQRGTGHAVQCALEAYADLDASSVVVMPGDHPFVTAASIEAVIAAREQGDAALALATVRVPDFEGVHAQFSDCGRICRDESGRIIGIVERKDASEEQSRICEVNVSYYCFRTSWLRERIARINADNAAGEYYLTDLVAAAFAEGQEIQSVTLEDFREGFGINTPEQLLLAEAQ